MPPTIGLANGTTINREDACDSEHNILARHSQFWALVQEYTQLWESRSAVSALVAWHVGVSPERIEMADQSAWMRGTFNVVVPMLIKNKDGEATGTDEVDRDTEQVLLRVPQPHKFGEEQHPGSVADKIRCEAASYIWMQQHCAEVRIPHLYAFSIPGKPGGHFSHASRLSLFRRIVLYVRQHVASWLRRPIPSAYLPAAPPPVPQPLDKTGYMILENLSAAKFGQQTPRIVPHDRPLHVHHDQEPVKTRNLCRSVARIMLALARVPQPRIGAFRFCLADGTIRLDGRPAACDTALLESEGAPRTIGLDTTYTSADQYIADLARFRDSAFRSNPNAVCDAEDGQYQMAVMAILRSVTHCFVGPECGDHSSQSFYLHLSDSNAGNLLVNENWEVTAIFDLEWLFAAPIGRLHAPWWLAWESGDVNAKAGYEDYCASRKVFMDVFQEEERKQTGTGGTPLSDAMNASWASQLTWFYLAHSSVSCMTHIFTGRLEHMFWPERPKMVAKALADKADTTSTADTADRADTSNTDPPERTDGPPYDGLWQMWGLDAETVLARKLDERKQYVAAVERLFD